MSKELEALEGIKNTKELEIQTAADDFIVIDFDINHYFEEEIQIIEKSLTPPTVDEVCGLLAKDLGLKNVFFKNYCFKFNPDGYDYTIIKYDEINDRIENYSQSALSVETTLNLCLFLKSVREEIACEMLIISHSKRLGKY